MKERKVAVDADGWFSAHDVISHDFLYSHNRLHFAYAFCPVHGIQLQDSNWEGKQFTRPTCLTCLSFKDPEQRIIHIRRQTATYDPWKSLRAMLIRYLVTTGQNDKALRQHTIKELAMLIGTTADDVWSALQAFDPPKVKKARKIKDE